MNEHGLKRLEERTLGLPTATVRAKSQHIEDYIRKTANLASKIAPKISAIETASDAAEIYDEVRQALVGQIEYIEDALNNQMPDDE